MDDQIVNAYHNILFTLIFANIFVKLPFGKALPFLLYYVPLHGNILHFYIMLHLMSSIFNDICCYIDNTLLSSPNTSMTMSFRISLQSMRSSLVHVHINCLPICSRSMCVNFRNILIIKHIS